MVNGDLPPDAFPATVNKNEAVSKLVDYDSTTGTGDSSTTYYTGGKCVGSTFDGTGATQYASTTSHFVVSEAGDRIDWVITSFTDPVGKYSDVSISGTYRRQTK